jgi:hypothetical protein
MSRKSRKAGTSSKNPGRFNRRALLAALGLGMAAPLVRAMPGVRDEERCGDGYGEWTNTSDKYWTTERKKEFEEVYWKKIADRIRERESLDLKIRTNRKPSDDDLAKREMMDLEIQVLRASATVDKCAFALALRPCALGTPTPLPK